MIPTFSSQSASASASASHKPARAFDYFDHMEIYPATKTKHFAAIQADSKIDYKDMLFFDDEQRNQIVGSSLGVTFCLVGDGMSVEEFDRGVRKWRKQQNGETPSQKSKNSSSRKVPN